MPKRTPQPEVEFRVSDIAGFVYLTKDDRVLWSRQGEEVEVTRSSNWGEVSKRQWELAAEALRRAFPGKTIKKVLSITHRER